jgi:hypothetical protein
MIVDIDKKFQLWKENVYSDGHQSHQYQQTKQSPLILTKLTWHKTTTTCDIFNPGPGLRQSQKCGGGIL